MLLSFDITQTYIDVRQLAYIPVSSWSFTSCQHSEEVCAPSVGLNVSIETFRLRLLRQRQRHQWDCQDLKYRCRERAAETQTATILAHFSTLTIYSGILIFQIYTESPFRWFVSMVPFGPWPGVPLICRRAVSVSAEISHSTANYEHDIGFPVGWKTLCWVAAHYHKSLHLYVSRLGEI